MPEKLNLSPPTYTANRNPIFRGLDFLSGGIIGGVTGDVAKRREDSILREQQIRAAVEEEARRRAVNAEIEREYRTQGLPPLVGANGEPDYRQMAILSQTEKVRQDAIRQAALTRAREEEQARVAKTRPFGGIIFNTPQELEQKYPASDFGYEVTPLPDGQVGVIGGFRPRAPKSQKPARNIPPGYEEDPDNKGMLRPIPGGPDFTKQKEKQARFERQLEGEKFRAQNVVSQIDEVIGNTNALTVGPGGKVLSVVWGTDAFDVGKLLETIKANIGFDRLQEMRKESPTGGALGQVAVQELVALQNSIASLEQAQSRDQFTRNLKRVRDHYERYIRAESGDESALKPNNAQEIIKIRY